MGQFTGVAHHAVTDVAAGSGRATVGFNDDERLFLNTVFFVFSFNFAQQHVGMALRTGAVFGFGKVNFTAFFIKRVNQPRVYTHQFGKTFDDFFVVFEIRAFKALAAGGVQGRQQVLLLDVFQNTRHPGQQLVIEQNGARVKVFEPQTAAATVFFAHYRL